MLNNFVISDFFYNFAPVMTNRNLVIGLIVILIMYFFKRGKNKNKGKSSSRRKEHGNPNSRQKRKARKETITEAQRLSIVNAVLSKRRLLVYTDSL